MLPAFVWTSTKNEWNAQKVMWSRAFGRLNTRNLTTRVLATNANHISTVIDQKRFDFRSLSPAPRTFGYYYYVNIRLLAWWEEFSFQVCLRDIQFLNHPALLSKGGFFLGASSLLYLR